MSDQLINKIKSLQKLSAQSEFKLLANLKMQKLKKNEILLAAGEPCKKIYYLESGCLMSVLNNDGKQVNLSITLQDNFATNLKSLRYNTPSLYDIRACELSVVWSFTKDALLDLYKESEELADFGRNLLEQLLIDQEEHSNLFKINNPLERYQYITSHNPLLLQKITLTELSSYLGISRKTLSRIRTVIK